MQDYEIELDEGMVVLDCVHRIQYEQEPDLAVRWNCKSGKMRLMLSRNQWPTSSNVHD